MGNARACLRHDGRGHFGDEAGYYSEEMMTLYCKFRPSYDLFRGLLESSKIYCRMWHLNCYKSDTKWISLFGGTGLTE